MAQPRANWTVPERPIPCRPGCYPIQPENYKITKVSEIFIRLAEEIVEGHKYLCQYHNLMTFLHVTFDAVVCYSIEPNGE